METSQTAPNYRYWQENGAYWVEEYSRRKKTQVYFNIQEFMLAEYIGRCASARVLDFGCGVGRHLQYLRQLPGIEIYGYDQSPTMLAGVRQWADESWYQDHITLGDPVTRLPYPDQFFDIVFTAEVLIHVRPEHLPELIQEFVRISRWQIYHLEPTSDYEVKSDDHGGCWNHDLVQAYANLGLVCEILPKGYQSQSPYRVVFDQSRALPAPIVSMAKLLELEKNIQPILNLSGNFTEELSQYKKNLGIMENFLEEARKRDADWQRLVNEMKDSFEQRSTQYEQAQEEARKRDADWQRLVNEMKDNFEQRSTQYEQALEEARKRDADWQRLVNEMKDDFEQRSTQYEHDLEEARKRDAGWRQLVAGMQLDFDQRCVQDEDELEGERKIIYDWQRLAIELKNDYEQHNAQHEKDMAKTRNEVARLNTEVERLTSDLWVKQSQLEKMNCELCFAETWLDEIRSSKMDRRIQRQVEQRVGAIKIFALGQANPASQGLEVWIISIKNSRYPLGISLKQFLYIPQNWTMTPDTSTPFGHSLVATGKAELSLPLEFDETLQIGFLSHPWSGMIGIEAQGRMTIVDLFHEIHRGIAIYPYKNPIGITELT